MLLETPGEIVSREQLRTRVWGDTTFVEFDQSLNYCVRRIRLALRDDASKPVFIETLPKQGYRFVGQLCNISEPPGEPSPKPSPEAPATSPETPPGASESALHPRRTWWWVAALAACIPVSAAIVWMLVRDPSITPAAPLNVSLLPPEATSFLFDRNGEGGFAISPDGRMLAFVGRTQGKAQLWVRRLNQSGSTLVPDSEGAYKPFWSPDSRWVAFFTPLKLKKSDVASGATVELCDVQPITGGGSWSVGGVILWSHGRMPLQRIPDIGGHPVPVPGTDGGVEPHFLPDGQRFLYRGGGYWSRDLWLASLEPGGKPRRLGETGEQPTYSAGHILAVSKGILTARPFDEMRGSSQATRCR